MLSLADRAPVRVYYAVTGLQKDTMRLLKQIAQKSHCIGIYVILHLCSSSMYGGVG